MTKIIALSWRSEIIFVWYKGQDLYFPYLSMLKTHHRWYWCLQPGSTSDFFGPYIGSRQRFLFSITWLRYGIHSGGRPFELRKCKSFSELTRSYAPFKSTGISPDIMQNPHHLVSSWDSCRESILLCEDWSVCACPKPQFWEKHLVNQFDSGLNQRYRTYVSSPAFFERGLMWIRSNSRECSGLRNSWQRVVLKDWRTSGWRRRQCS